MIMNTTATAPVGKKRADEDYKGILARIYNESEIHLLTADYADGQIVSTSRWFTPTCYRREPTHLTRIQIVTYVGQLSYLFGALLGRHGLLPISEDDYLRRIESDKATFMELKLRFRQFIKPNPKVDIRIACRRGATGEPVVKHLNKLLVAPFLFEIGNGACTGESEAVLILD